MSLALFKRKQRYLGQTKSSLYRRLKRRIRNWRERQRKGLKKEREVDFLDVIDERMQEKQLRSRQEDGYEVIEKDE